MRPRPLSALPLLALVLLAVVAAPFAVVRAPASAEEPAAAGIDGLRIATPGDDGPHPGVETEWWYVNVMNPATKETFIVTLQKAPIANSTSFWYDRFGAKSHLTGLSHPYVADMDNGLTVCSGDTGCLDYDPAKRAYHLVYAKNGISADLWLKNIRPGVTSHTWYDGQENNWVNPVATSDVTGWVWPVGYPAPVSADGWRGYHDHNWGDFDLADDDYYGWEWGGSHEPNGNARVMGGVIDGNGIYHGQVVQVSAQGTTFCKAEGPVGSPALTLSDWDQVGGFNYPRKVETACTDGGAVAGQTWSVTGPHLVDTGLFKFSESVGLTVPGSVGLVEHFRSNSHEGS